MLPGEPGDGDMNQRMAPQGRGRRGCFHWLERGRGQERGLLGKAAWDRKNFLLEGRLRREEQGRGGVAAVEAGLCLWSITGVLAWAGLRLTFCIQHPGDVQVFLGYLEGSVKVANGVILGGLEQGQV